MKEIIGAPQGRLSYGALKGALIIPNMVLFKGKALQPKGINGVISFILPIIQRDKILP